MMYPSRSRCALAVAAAAMFAAEFAVAQTKPAIEFYPPKTVRLTLTPAAAPTPALQYTLLPSPYEQIAGNAESMLQTASNLLPNDAETKTLRDKLDDWLKLPPTELPRDEVTKLLYSMGSALRYAYVGARREYCHWEIPWEEGFNAMLPSLGSLRQISRGLALQARVNLADGKVDAALRDLQAIQGVARYVGGGPTLIHTLVGAAISGLAANQLELWAETKGAPNLYWAYVKLPHPLVDTWPGLRGESMGIISDFPEFKYIDKVVLRQDEIDRVLNRMVEMVPLFAENPPEEWKNRETLNATFKKMLPVSREYLLAHGRTAEQLKKLPPEQIVLMHSLDRGRYWMDEEQKCFGLPYWQMRPLLTDAHARLDKVKQDQREGLFTPLLANLTRPAAITAVGERRLAMLRIIEAIRMYAAGHKGQLPATLDALEVPVPLDNTTGKAFEYTVQGDAATLRSAAEPTGVNNEVIAYELRIAR